jgi:hypothetical protein
MAYFRANYFFKFYFKSTCCLNKHTVSLGGCDCFGGIYTVYLQDVNANVGPASPKYLCQPNKLHGTLAQINRI